MAFPTIAATNNSANATATTSHTVNLPTGISAGDLLLIFFACPANNSPSATGWSGTRSDFAGSLSYVVLSRVADGTEGTTVTVSTGSTSVKSAHISYRITGVDTTRGAFADGVVASAENSGITSTPDPLNANPGTTEDFLWIAAEFNVTTDAVTVYPTNYSLSQVNKSSGGTGGASTKCSVGVAGRQLTASAEDPGTFTIAGSDFGYAVTLAIAPLAAAVVLDPMGMSGFFGA